MVIETKHVKQLRTLDFVFYFDKHDLVFDEYISSSIFFCITWVYDTEM